MTHSDHQGEGVSEADAAQHTPSIEDKSIKCIDCLEDFLWTAGEQTFFRDKGLENPPKRCKPCKKAKTRRLDAIEQAKVQGKKHVIEMKAECARCGQSTTIPFYPSQGKPVYCRACFLEIKAENSIPADAY
jgi:CxxC-x17-CxxC domain-containing protein